MQQRRRHETWSLASVAGAVITTTVAAAGAGLIMKRMVGHMWGQPLLSAVGSRNMPLWLAWAVLMVILAICVVFIGVGARYLYRVARGRVPRVPRR